MAKNKSFSKDNQKFKQFNSNKTKNDSNKGFKGSAQKNISRKPKDKQTSSKVVEDNKKINYVLHPRLLNKKLKDVKQNERKEKEKAFQLKKRKRNAIFMKTTDKGQPKLNARMKILYDQIARSCENT